MNFIDGSVEATDGGARFIAKESGLSWQLPGLSAPATTSPMTMGVRPEHVGLSREPGNGAMATVSLVEPVGAVTYIDLEFGETTFKASTDPEAAYQAEEKLTVRLNPRQLYFFDTASGERVRL
ncbi:MAG: TOBE domain-containing protein [Chloroflexota bacterium]|nr:TOBE domain-containing protein [Chloroflexota bacterium]